MESYPLESLFEPENYCGEEDNVYKDCEFENDVVMKLEGVGGGPRKIYTLEELDDKIRNCARPPPMRDEASFHNVCSLHNKGTNPHRLQVKKHVPLSSLQAIFGQGCGRSGLRYTDCEDIEIQKFVEDIWLLCYGKAHNKVDCQGVLSWHYCTV
jgi:hypothetical protein